MRRLGLIVAVVALLAGGFLLVRWLFPGDEARIRKLLEEVAQAASLKGDEHPLVKLGGGNKVGGFFTDDVVVELSAAGVGERRLEGREELVQAVNAARASLQQALIQLEEIRLEIDAGRGDATARLVAVARIDSATDPIVQELVMRLVRTDAGWRIRRVEPVRARVLSPEAP